MNQKNDPPMSALAGVLNDEPQVLAAYLFGSSVDGTASPSSDVDVGVLFSTNVSLKELIRIEALLDESISQTVDLVDLRRASPFVALDVVRGDRFFCRDETIADEFDLYVLRRAGDLEYYERRRRAFYLESAVSEGGS